MVLRDDGGTVDLAPDTEARAFVDGGIMPSVVEQNPPNLRTRLARRRRAGLTNRPRHADDEADRDHLDRLRSGGVSITEAMRSMERTPQVAADRHVDFITLTFEPQVDA